jgi:hypothetical protein
MELLRTLIPARPRALLRILAVKVCVAMLLCQIAFHASAAAAGDKAVPLERGVKAAFLYKFLNYIEWPQSIPATSPLTIGVVAADDIAAELAKAVQDRSVNNRPVVVKRLQEGDSLAGVHLLFIGGTDGARLDRWLKLAQPRGVVTVTESDDETRVGVINFVPVDGRIRFDISLDAAEKYNVKLSSRMLQVARVVQKGSQ